MEPTLSQLYADHRGKVSDKWSFYLPEYDRLFQPYRNRPVRLLEIGVSNGGSLEIWSRYFAQAVRIVGCDINPDCARLQYADPRISVVVGDANDDATFARILEISQGFDLIIDDGSHHSGDIVRAFARYFPLLSDGGLYVAEDLHCSYWRRFEGGLFYPYASIGFFKRLADVVNSEHWGNNQPRGAVLGSFGTTYGVGFDEAALARVHSVEFANSMCAVRKAPPSDNALGYRTIAGTEEHVLRGHLPLRGGPYACGSEMDNEWSVGAQPPEEELKMCVAQIVELQRALAERDQQIDALSRALSERDRR
jgi:Methyltransferase domain